MFFANDYSFGSNGLAVVTQDHIPQIINEEGETLVWLTEFEDDPTFEAGIFQGDVVIIQTGDSAPFTSFVINSEGKVIVKGKYEGLRVTNERYIVAVEKGIVIQIMDLNGKPIKGSIKEILYSDTELGMSVYKDIANGDQSYISQKTGVLDGTGGALIPPQYESIQLVNDQRFIAQKDGLYGILDRDNQTVEAFRYKGMGHTGEGLLAGSLDGVKWGYIAVPGDGYDPAQAYKPKVMAQPATALVKVDGKLVRFEAYNIAGHHNFKLRDLAMAFKGSSMEFAVSYEASSRTITLKSKKAYAAVGGELSVNTDTASMKLASDSSPVVDLDGRQLFMSAYNIAGSNYFKLRDLGAALDFEVKYDLNNKTILVDTGKGYTAE